MCDFSFLIQTQKESIIFYLSSEHQVFYLLVDNFDSWIELTECFKKKQKN